MPSSRSPTPPSPQQLRLYTYYCLCSTHLLTTPYDIATLPQRRHPSVDLARILPLPSIYLPPPPPPRPPTDHNNNEGEGEAGSQGTVLPSLLSPNLKPVRKPLVVQREDGWEKRKMWRCGRCGLGVGYEVVSDPKPGEGQGNKVLFLLDGGLVEKARWED
ncbi:MAG: hypothetical protein Q9196_005594 [Gyalolechia fulgens]